MTATTGAILDTVGSVVTQSMTWAGAIVNFITSTPLVLIFVTVSLVGLGIGILGRILNLRG